MATTTSSGSSVDFSTPGSPALTSTGLGSGLDVAGLVGKLMAVESQPLTALDKKTSIDNAKISAYGTFKGSLSALQGALANLSTADKLRTLTATVADTGVMSASVASGAVAGKYSVEVTDLANAHKLASTAFAASTTSVGTGTLTFDFGTFATGAFTSNGGGAKTVTIGPGQDTLAGIRDAVNAANIGVTATIVNDGNSPGTRLVFTSNASGAANSLKISVSDGDGNPTDAAGLSQLAYDPAATAGSGKNMEQKVEAQDAQLVIDGIAVHSASNQVKNAIDGISLNLVKTNEGTPTTLTVASDTNTVAANIAGFIKGYNDLRTTIGTLTKYDTTTKQASVLTGDTTVLVVQNQLRSLLGGSIGSGALTTLSQIGVSFQADGTLALNRSKLDAAIASNPTGVTQLLAAMGTTTDSLASVTGFTAKTTPGTYALNVTQLATQGNLVGQSPAGLTITAGVNDSLGVVINGIAATVTLGAATYASADALAAEVAAKINGASALSTAGAGVTVAQSGGTLTLTSNAYGSTSVVSASGNAAANLFGATPTVTPGVDVAGTLDGNAVTGAGRALVGIAGTPLEGLQVQVAGGALGARGTVTFANGFAARLNSVLASVLDTTGSIAARTDGLNSDLKDISDRKDVLNARLQRVQAQYYAQFNALDNLLASLASQSNQLAQQLASLPKANSNG